MFFAQMLLNCEFMPTQKNSASLHTFEDLPSFLYLLLAAESGRPPPQTRHLSKQTGVRQADITLP